MNEKIDTQRVGRKIPRDQLAAYGLMLGSNNLIGVIRNFYLFAYLIDVFGLQLELYMLAGLLFLAYNALNDVLFGIYADKPRHKLGRRVPYIRYGSLFLILTNILIWFPWFGTFPGNANAGVIMKFVQYLIYLFVWDTVGTIVFVSFNAWVPEVSESDKERTNVSIIIRIANLIGGLSVLILPTIWKGGNNMDVFRIFLVVCNTINALCLFVGSYIIKERPELYKTSYKEKSTKEIFKQFLGLYKKKAFLSSLLFGFSTGMMVMLMNLFPVLLGYGLGLSEGEIVVSGIFYLSSYGMIPLLSRMVKSKPVDKVIVNIIKYGMVLLSVFCILMIIPGLHWFFYPILAMAGAMSMVGLYAPLFGGNAIDQDELETGQRREALYGGASALFIIPMNEFLGSFVAFGLIVINYQEGQGFLQEESVLAGIRLLFFIIVFIGGSLTLISIRIYPFKGDALVKLKKDIIALHAKKEAGVIPNQESTSK